MSLTKILTFVFLAIAIGIAYYLFDRIKYSIEEEERIAAIEAQVIDKLKYIRDAQLLYKEANGQYTSDWNKLISFLDTGELYIVQRREITTLLDYGAEETTIEIDTLGSIPVRDTLYHTPIYNSFKIENIASIPHSGQKFELFADKISRNNVEVDVFEVVDIAPVNPERRGEESIKGPLRVGSRTEVTTGGNWE
ncbi:hypothetical protein [Tunicatimonas pelagia]|uniref:hypothetical protein n=1 Tax=Tunicatimonas pelagia TaxID=931531 RepID=UPI002665F86C|nr:hypothetical protein [Tunicatimonas pelagia]WKN45925.1 hypothetical protein P0M28_13255 [Tunicatimonas pelagia]